tara:strand:+ start:134 stop:622 length:489 start_codon:yes stop_codon:yes gene_type:complete
MNYSSSLNQIFIYITLSLLISFCVNILRTESLAFIAVPLKKIEDITQIENSSLQPQIREISIDVAERLFSDSVLFIDARAEENYLEGHIPNSICNDDFDSLIIQVEDIIANNDGFVVYCSDDDCGSSEDLSYQLQDQGFTNIYLFKGGWKQWTENNLPIELK